MQQAGKKLTRQPDNAGKVKTKSFERNVLQTAKGGSFLAAGRLFEFASRFVIAFMLARLLGAEDYGLYNLAISAAVIVASIASLGMDDGLVRYVAMQNGERDEEAVWGTLQIGIGISACLSVLLGFVLFLLAEPIADFVFHEPQLAPLLKLFSLFLPVLTLSNILVAAARGFKRMDLSALAENVIQFVIRMILIGILLIIGLDVFVASIVFGISELAATVALIYLLHRHFSFKRPFRQARREFREIITFSIPFWLTGMLTKFRKNLQTILLGTFSTVLSVGVFSIVSKVNLLGRISYLSIITSVKPILADLHRKEKMAEMGRLYQTATRWTFMFNLPIFLVMVLFPSQILSIFGSSYVGGATALIVLAFAELANAGTGICGSIVDMTGYTKVKMFNSILWVGLLLACNLLLIPQWGVLGAATATLIATASVNLLRVIEVWLLLQMQPYNRTFLKPVIAALAAVLSFELMNFILPAENALIITILHIVVVTGVYGGLLFVLGLAPEDKFVFSRFFRQITGVFTRSRAKLNRERPA